MSNVHPWFANVSVAASASWTTQFFQENNVNVANGLPNKPTMYIAETGAYCTLYLCSTYTENGFFFFYQ